MAFLLFGGGLLLVSFESEIIKTDGDLGLGVILGFSCLFVCLQPSRCLSGSEFPLVFWPMITLKC